MISLGSLPGVVAMENFSSARSGLAKKMPMKNGTRNRMVRQQVGSTTKIEYSSRLRNGKKGYEDNLVPVRIHIGHIGHIGHMSRMGHVGEPSASCRQSD